MPFINEERLVKSKLQKKLETKGWRFLTNVTGNKGMDAEIQQEYFNRGFTWVHVDNVYDRNERVLPNDRAVYVREQFVYLEGKGYVPKKAGQ